MAIYGVHRIRDDGTVVRATINRRNAVAVIVAIVIVVGIPLTLTSISIARRTTEESEVHDAGSEWADTVGWELVAVGTQAGSSSPASRDRPRSPTPAACGHSCCCTASTLSMCESSSCQRRPSISETEPGATARRTPSGLG
jgi:hypothetical protein